MRSVILYEMLDFYDHGSSALPSAPVMLRLAAYSTVAAAKVVFFSLVTFTGGLLDCQGTLAGHKLTP